MIYSKFINKTKKYLKSVRLIKDYISFDMLFSDNWVILKEYAKDIEVIKNEQKIDGLNQFSFVCKLHDEDVDKIEKAIDKIIKYNIEKEEKDKLFKQKIVELKNIFDSKKLNSLQSLKFNIDEIDNIVENLTGDEREYGDDISRNEEVREGEKVDTE